MTKKKPLDPLSGRGIKKEPWEAGPWCARCVYYARINIGHSCDYYSITGQLRPDEPTKRCSVKRVRERPKPTRGVRHVKDELNGAAGPEWLTFRDIGLVVRKATSTISKWGKDAGLDRHIDGYHGVQVTADEAFRMLQGHRYAVEDPEGMSPAQLELRRMLLEAGESEISSG